MIYKIKRSWKQLLLVLAMVFSVTVNSLNTVSAETVSFTWGEEIYYPSWLGNWSTKKCYINGSLAYCLEASKNTPPENENARYVISTNEALLKVLYYGYGGPAQCVFLNETDKIAYLYTHILASYAYSGDIYGGKDWDDLEANGIGIKSVYEYIQSLPLPTNELNFNGESNPTFVAYYENGRQRTQDITLNTTTTASVNINLQDDVELHNVTKGTVSTGSVSVNGKDTFYLTAPLKSLEKYSTGELSGIGLLMYAPLVIQGNAKYQSEGTISTTQDPATVQFNVNWMDVGGLELRKTNDTGKLIDGSEFLLKHLTLDYEKDLIVKDGKISVSGLPTGNYLLTETKVPNGHSITQQTFEVTINKDQITEQIVVNKLRPIGNLKINKSLENVTEDAVNLGVADLTKVNFKITANQDIYDSVSLELLYSKGDSILIGSGTGSNNDKVELVKGTNLNDGIYACDSLGQLELIGLPMGTYDIKEVSCPEGYVMDNEVKTVQFSQQDFTTLTYNQSVDVNNDITKTVISKSDMGDNELSGAHMQIWDQDKNIIFEWVSSDTPQEIYGLSVGEYTLHEDLAPLGFAISNDFNFIVDETGKVQHINMVDNFVKVNKVDEENNLLKNATFEVVNSKTKNIVDRWTSGAYLFDITEEMKLELEAGKIVSDMFINEDDSSVLYRITPNDESDDYMLMLQSNGETSYSYIDIEGNETDHLVNNLQQDASYILREVDPPKGYATAKEVEFTLDNKDIDIQVVNQITKVEVSKVDITSNQELPGATLQVFDKDNNLIDEWVSTTTPHMIKGLNVGESYILKETIAPDGYQIANEIEFKIEDTGEIQKVIMKDELLPSSGGVKTGDNTLIDGMVLLLVGSSIAIYGLSRKKKD